MDHGNHIANFTLQHKQRRNNIELLKSFLAKDFNIETSYSSIDSSQSLHISPYKKDVPKKRDYAKFLTLEDKRQSEIIKNQNITPYLSQTYKFKEKSFTCKELKGVKELRAAFIPSINPVSEKLMREKYKDKSIWEHLHGLGKERKEKFDQTLLETKLKEEEDDLRKCTFQPEIKKSSVKFEEGIYERSQTWKQIIDEK